MIPLRDNIPSRTPPVVNSLLILCSCIVFLLQGLDSGDSLIFQYALIPARLQQPDRPLIIQNFRNVQTPSGNQQLQNPIEIPPSPFPAWATLCSCIFLHGSLMHLVGNLWFLWIFGDNVEDRLGHLPYLCFYLACGSFASFCHYAVEPASTTPTIGASGAVAAVMGAYLVLYPHANVISLVPVVFFLHLMVIPAPVFLGIWFLIQLFQGSFAAGGGEAGGVAWWAHIGGFLLGLLIALLLAKTRNTNARVTIIRPGTDRHFRRISSPWD
ncbi:MAG: rhomboid family intramembrane serine protease [Planctomycetota bacterium]